MTGFWAGVVGMLALALWFVVRPLLRQKPPIATVDDASANLAVLRDQLAELESDFANGRIGAAQHATARAEIERRVVEDVAEGEPPPNRAGSRVTAVALALTVPILAAGLYMTVGNPGAINPPVTAERKDNRESAGKRWHRVEHRYGQFARTISLPNDAAAAGIDAVYKQGVLTITVPKALESRPTKIAVKTA